MPDGSVTISESRTYILVLHDPTCPNGTKLETVTLPKSYKNDSFWAGMYYRTSSPEQPIFASVAIEDYMKVVEDVLFDKSKPAKKPWHTPKLSNNSDMEAVRIMLNEWNRKQDFPCETHAITMGNILHQLGLYEKVIDELVACIGILISKGAEKEK